MKDTLLDIAKRVDVFFMEQSPIHQAMRRSADALREMNIPFAIAGAMAANAHGHKRTTADVDVLMRAEDLQRFKLRWIGRRWTNNFAGSKGLRDAQHNVEINVPITGQYPGDGLPKPVVFPEPEAVSEILDESIPSLSGRTLVESKLAGGMSASHRLRDLSDVMQLILANKLSREYAASLNAYVRDKFLEMWQAAQVDDVY